MCDEVQVSDALFTSNKATFGGAVYILAEDDKQTLFSECVLEGNTAEDGGGVYLNTGPGLDIFNGSVFRNNFAGKLSIHVRACEIELQHHIILFLHNVIDRVR